VLVPAGSVFEILSATTGARLFSYDTGAQIYAAPSIADGLIYVSNIDGEMFAFGLPTRKARVPADPTCPHGFTCQRIGSASAPGREAGAASCTRGPCAAAAGDGSLKIFAAGAGVNGTSDSFRLISKPTTGTDQVVARIDTQPAAAGSQVGIMIRQRRDPGSPYYAVLEEPNHQLVVQYRTAFGGATSQAHSETGPKLPVYLMIQRHGDLLEAATSSDGKTFTLVPGAEMTVPMPARSLAGVAVSSGAAGRLVRAVVSKVSVGRPTTTPRPYPSAHPCPTGYSCADIGDPALVGDQSLAGTTWTLSGSGFDIWATSDQFHFVWQPVTANASVSARVTSVSNTSPNSKAGVMLRAGTGAAAAWYGVFVTPGDGIEVQYRSQAGDICAQNANPAGGPPQYLRVADSGGVFTAYASADGVNWTPISGSATPLPDLSGPLIGGIALGAHDAQAVATATFTSVSIS
jgi:hypothetical protein